MSFRVFIAAAGLSLAGAGCALTSAGEDPALKQAIAEGDAAYARGEFTTFDTAAEFADDLKSRLMKRQQRTRD